MAETVTGGCQCGRIRYEVRIDDDGAYLCHCRMCQRASGGVALPLKQVGAADLAWTTRPPELYRSSPIAERGFCAACGTPLTFAYVEDNAAMDLTVGSFDDPYRFHPTGHFATESRHEMDGYRHAAGRAVAGQCRQPRSLDQGDGQAARLTGPGGVGSGRAILFRSRRACRGIGSPL